MCDMTHYLHDTTHSYLTYFSHVWHDSFNCVPWLIHMCTTYFSHVWHDSFNCVPWHFHMCATYFSRVWHDSFNCVPWLIYMCATYFSHVWHDSFKCVPWLIHMCATYFSHVWHDSFGSLQGIPRHQSDMCDMTQMCVSWPIRFTSRESIGLSLQGGKDPKDALSCRSLSTNEPLVTGLFCEKLFHFKGVYRPLSTGWRRSKGCLKFQVIFRKRAVNYRAFLRKICSLEVIL